MVLPTSSEDVRDVAGVWIRIFEADPLDCEQGMIDFDTFVAWVQSPCGFYVDLRLPKGSPGRSRQAAIDFGFTALEPQALAATGHNKILEQQGEEVPTKEVLSILVQTKGFAGVLMTAPGETMGGASLANDPQLVELAEDQTCLLPLRTCFWRRDCDIQPPTRGLDVGVCAAENHLNSDGTLDMRETGSDGSYAEGWRRSVGTENGPFCALELIAENNEKRTGVWVRAGDQFAYAIGRPSDAKAAKALGCAEGSDALEGCTGMTLEEAALSLSEGDPGAALSQVLTYVAVVGVIEGESWIVEYSSYPGLVGCSLIGGDASRCCSTVTKNGSNTLEQVLHGENRTRLWKVHQLEGFTFPTPTPGETC